MRGPDSHAAWEWDLSSGRIKWNDALSALFGHRETVTDAAWREDHMHPEDRDRVRLSLQKATIVNDGTPWVESYRFCRADGSYALVTEQASVVRDDEGPYRVVGTIAPSPRPRIPKRTVPAS